MKKLLPGIILIMLTVNFYSCISTREGDFSKVKYLEKYVSKKKYLPGKSTVLNKEAEAASRSALQEYYQEVSINENLLPQTDLKSTPVLAPISILDNDGIPFSDKTVGVKTQDIHSKVKVKSLKRHNYRFFAADKSLVKSSDEELIIKVILCFLLPPLAIFMHEGITNFFWLSLILTIFFWVPGVVFSLLRVLGFI